MKDFYLNKDFFNHYLGCYYPLGLAFNQMQQIIKYYTFHDIPFNVSIDCHKPIIINNVKK